MEIYSRLRDKLVADIDEYNRHLDDAVNLAVNTLPTLYKRAWVDDIDEGLREWVNVNHRIAGYIMLHRPRAENDPTGIDLTKDELRRYALLHILSMSGAPGRDRVTVGGRWHRCTLPVMLRFAFRRFYFATVGLLLLTVPIFALLRWAALHRPPPCIATRCPAEDHWVTRIIRHDGPFYLLWQSGPPYDY